jgi:RNA polymerase sigma-70 factor (ECF subfamily)
MAEYQDPDQRGIEFIGLLARQERRLTAYVATLVPNWADVDDILQATKLKLWEQFGQYDPTGDFGAWARKIAFYQVLTYRKKLGRDRSRFSPETLDLLAEELAAASEEADARRAALDGCLNKLTMVGRQLLWHFYGGEDTVKDMALKLGRSVRGTQRAVAKLRGDLQECIERAVCREENR